MSAHTVRTARRPFRCLSESARTTAELIVLDGHRLPSAGLSAEEIRACVMLAHERRIRRSLVAERIGWTPARLLKWSKDRGIAYSEEGYPDEPLKWLTRVNANKIKDGQRERPFNSPRFEEATS